MKELTNIHTHCRYCHGQGEPEEYLEAARSKGFRSLANGEEGEVEVLLGLEVEYLPGLPDPESRRFAEMDLDFRIGSIQHMEFLADGREYYRRLNEMITTCTPDLVGHFDIIEKNNGAGRFFSEEDLWYRELVQESLALIAESGAFVEVNTGGIVRKTSNSLYPSAWIVGLCREMGIPLSLNSDAHSPAELDGYFTETEALLKEMGWRALWILTKAGWKENPL